jgi:FG-GAP-like repeat
VNGDKLPDLVTSAAHDYGIFWFEQAKTPKGERNWVKHVIDNSWSQAHALTLADLNGDGRPELITGKRYMAHNGRDPGEREPLGVYWYEYLQFSRLAG